MARQVSAAERAAFLAIPMALGLLTKVMLGDHARRAAARHAEPGADAAPRLADGADRGVSRMATVVEVLTVLGVYAVFAAALFPIARVPALNPDSGTVLSISRTLSEGHIATVWNTQSPILQDVTYAVLMTYAPALLHYPIIVTSFLTALLLGLLAWRISGAMICCAAPVVVLMFSDAFWQQTGSLTFYATFVVLGYAGLYLCIHFAVGGSSYAQAVIGAVLLSASLYAYTTAIVFLCIPMIAACCWPSRKTVSRTALIYAAVGLLIAPFVFWHIEVGGVAHFYYHPLNWFTEKYLGVVNTEFWHYERQSPTAYAYEMGRVGLFDVVPPGLLALALPGLWEVQRRMGGRAVVFCLACFGIYGALLEFTRPSPFARYYFPILPLLVGLIAAGLFAIARTIAESGGAASEHSVALRTRLILCLVMVVVAGFFLVGHQPQALVDAHRRYVAALDTSAGADDLSTMAQMIGATRGGVIARDSTIQQLVPDNQVYTHFLLTEPEYVNYLAWPNDATVRATLDARDIEWVILRNDVRWERDYNVWLAKSYGVPPQHYLRIAASPLFEVAYRGPIYTLYHAVPNTGLARH